MCRWCKRVRAVPVSVATVFIAIFLSEFVYADEALAPLSLCDFATTSEDSAEQFSENATSETAELPTDSFTPSQLVMAADIFEDRLESNVEPSTESHEPLARIGKVHIKVEPIFDESDPDEDNWLFHWVNRLHISTRESVIADDLLFAEGDALDGRRLAESERVLRTRRYLNAVNVKARSPCEAISDVDVVVRDVWTLMPEVAYSRGGGENSYSFGLRDSNFLGSGKTIGLVRDSSPDRAGTVFNYYDPNTGPLRSAIDLNYSNNEDGQARGVAFVRPFFSLQTDWAGGVSANDFERTDYHYNAGEEVNQYRHQSQNASTFYGRRFTSDDDHVFSRWLVGFTQAEDDFFPSTAVPSTLLPHDRAYAYPWVEYQHVQDGYIKATNVQHINRVEDINLGSDFRARLGYSPAQKDQVNGSYVLEADYTQGFAFTDSQLFLLGGAANGYYDTISWQGAKVAVNADYHWNNFERSQFYASARLQRSWNMFADQTLELGGDQGLRGYPSHYQSGDRAALFTLEQRYYFESEFLSLFHLGAAVFADAGRAWGDSPFPQDQTGWLRDVGFGLRFSGTRTGNRDGNAHNVLHIDVAVPLDGDTDIAAWQWLVKVKKTF